MFVETPGEDHEHLCRDFIDGISVRSGINLHPFDPGVWVRGAESTMLQSNMKSRHQRLDPNDLIKAGDKVWEVFRTVSPEDYDCTFFRLAFDLRIKHLPFMTFGRAQKFINILSKYAYCYYWSGIDPAWNAINGWVKDLSSCFHIPVDAIVLHNLRQENRTWFRPLISTHIILQGRKYARIKCGDKAVGWSALDQTYPYIAIQQYVIDNLRGALSPLHREMRDLWS